MEIKTKKNKIKIEEYFKSFNDFKLFITNENEFININNLSDKAFKIYHDLIHLNKSIKLSLLGWFVIQQFEFKIKSAYKLEFWKERGNDINEYNNWLLKRNNIEQLKPLGVGIVNKFKYGNFKFEYNGIPKCRLCGGNLNYDVTRNVYVINSCENGNCETSKIRIFQL